MASDRRTWSHILAVTAVAALALVLAVLGLMLFGGGIWLIGLGGSWYYAAAGIGLLVSAAFLAAGSLWGVAAYLLTYVFTLIWAFVEVGLDGWALVPRVVAPTVILAFVLLVTPLVRRAPVWRWRPNGDTPARAATAAVTALFATVLAVELYALNPPGSAVAQEAPEATPLPDPSEPLPVAPAEAADAGAVSLSPAMAMLETGIDWPAYGGTYHAKRYSPLDRITRENVGELQRVWEYRTRDMPDDDQRYAAETTPLVIDGAMYLCSAKNILISLDPGTGRERWRYDPGVPNDAIPYNASCRGVAYYRVPEMSEHDMCAGRVIQGTLDGRLIAVDAATGQPCPDFGVNGQVNLLAGIGFTVPGWFAVTSPPTIVRGVVVIGHQVRDGQHRDAPSGVVRGYDAVTGEMRWAWDMGRPGETGLPPEGEVYTRGTPNMWTIGTGDDELGLIYAPLGVSAVDYYGALRSAEEHMYASSLVAIDVETGEPRWHFRPVYYDVWDYDLGSQGTLADFPTPDGPVPALFLPTKMGDIYVLDRATGEPLVPVEERPVPRGGVEADNISPVQPFSTYHTVATPDLTEQHMWGMSPIDQLWCRIEFRRHAYDGIYTPPTSEQRWIQFPGYNGGSDWGGISIDEERGILVANYNITANSNRLVPREDTDAQGVRPLHEPEAPDGAPPDGLSAQGGAPYGISVNAGWRVPFTGLLCTQPPYGGIRAIDLATGETLWDQPFGSARNNGPFGIPSRLPFTIGTPNNAGPILTASGVMFIAATTDDVLRAYDIETGAILWEDVLPAGGQATPITYEHDGRQFVVMMAGGHSFMETKIGDYVFGYALPD